jgi:cyclopropane fatty-acyl-phospholipid synthase-like methyltransferase
VDYNRSYTQSTAYFGDAPDPVLVRCGHLLERGRPVLDVGCGQGRNALYLARKGITVHALDPSTVAIEQLQRTIAADELPVITAIGRFQEVRPKHSDYGGILVFGLIQEMPWREIDDLRRFCREHIATGGLLFVTCFTTVDPSYAIYSDSWETIGQNSFLNPLGTVRTFLEPDQILSLFDDYETVHHWEGLGPVHRHGNGEPERHGRAEAVLRRK